ncbi:MULTISPECIES: carbohydrate ABC transporter permease [Paenibacillus]|jgi:multiple sugar transport system permease protein|uniref:ABC transporter permease subunit n=1 Tax=Paenibacillus phytohabitans TaxID=2654978 RepID=A0ABX1YMH7_9BACL|nr:MULTISPECIES: sugar ABC transporter permease [Paenibacillus]NOU82262.1 ABC transporter permease subunit [Paenibacillus phytohabitans]
MKLESSPPLKALPAPRTRFRIRWTPVLFLLPSIIVFIVFKYYLIFSAVQISLFNYDIVNPPGRFVGLENYFVFLQTSTFWLALKNTFIIFLLSVALTFWVPIVQAIFLSEIRKANGVYRVLYQIPSILPVVAGALLWKWMYNPDSGLFNYLLGKIGLGPYGWLNDINMTKFAIVLPGFFASGGIGVLLYYAAIKSIPAELFESAKIDGCGPWRRIRSLVLPNIRFVILIQFISFMSGALLAFDNIFILTKGGPADASLVVSLLIQRSAFEQSNFGMSAALSFFMFLVIALLTVIQFKLQKEEN